MAETISGVKGTTDLLQGNDGEHWEDRAGPIGAVDDVLSWRVINETETSLFIIVHYREE